ncbi:MAG: FixH family protein [Myxococcota bacterium]|nr:FixH family protein [Myxococcota bacterium]
MVGTLLLALPLVGCPSNGGGGSLCGDEDRAEPFEAGTTRDGENGTLSFRVDGADPGPPDLNENDWTVTVLDADGSPVDGCTVEVAPWMPDHGHGSDGVVGSATGEPGQYLLESIDFIMPGFWSVDVQADCGGSGSDHAPFPICIEG